jgi:hypothetical protein
VLLVLVERRRADGAQLAAGEHRLEQVGGVDRALGGAGADDRVQLVHEEDDLAARVGDLLEDRLQALLELAAVLRAGQQRADVERDDAAVHQRLGDVLVDDPLREALDDRGLADARLADEDRVVLGAAGEDLDDAADLVVAADHRVELALAGLVGEVAAELLQRLEGVLGVLAGHAVPSAHLADGAGQRVVRGAGAAQRVAGAAGRLREGEEEVLRGDVLVAEPAGLALRGAQHVEHLARRARLAGAGRDGGQRRRAPSLTAGGSSSATCPACAGPAG